MKAHSLLRSCVICPRETGVKPGGNRIGELWLGASPSTGGPATGASLGRLNSYAERPCYQWP